MFRILDRNRKVIGLLQSPIEPRIEEAINGMYELYFSVPSSFKGLELEGYIQIENEHEYVIKEIVTHGTNREVVAIMNVEEIFGNSWVTFRSVDTNVYDCMREILSGTNWRAVNQSTREVTRSLLGSNTTSWDLISQFCSIYDVEVKFDTYKKEVTIVDRLGGDLGVYFMNELNLKQLNHDSHTHKYITQVIPVGKDGMTIEDINDGRLYVSDYTYTDKKITGIWKADSYNDKQALKEDAQKFLAEMAVPYQTYECLVVDLSKAQGANNFAYNIGDIITLIDNTTNQRVKQRIIKQTRYLIDPSSNTIQIANKNMTFQDYYKRLQLIANMTEQILNGDGTISSDKIEVGDVDFTLKADSITAEHIKSNQIFARHIVADNITAEHIKSEQIDTRHLKANIINAGHIQAGSIQAGSGIIAEGAIGDAQISNINANKINAGEIDTSKVRVTGEDGFLFIENNTLYVVDNNRQIRVELGSIQDATNFGFIVRGADGQTILIDHNGVKNAGLTDGSVDNRVVSENANISGKKLDINSVIRRINEDGSVKITGTVVQVGETTLDIKMSEQNNKITEQGKKLETQQSQITSNTEAIKLKVDNQTYIEDKQSMTSKLDKNTSAIDLLQNEIKLTATKTEVENVKNEMEENVSSKIEEAKSEIKVTTDAITSNVSKNYYTKQDIDGKGYQTESQVQQTVDGLQVKVQQSGGYNLLYNGDFSNNLNNWEVVGDFLVTTNSTSPCGISAYAKGAIGETKYIRQMFPLEANQNSYVLSGYVYTSDFGEDGGTNPFRCLYCAVNYKDGTTSYYNVTNSATNKWEKLYIKIKKPSDKAFESINVSAYVRDTTKQISFSQLMFEKGDLPTEYTPNPNEIFAGITTINKDGVIVNQTNAKSKTSMTADGFAITRTDNSKDIFRVGSNGLLTLNGVFKCYKDGANMSGARLESSGAIMFGYNQTGGQHPVFASGLWTEENMGYFSVGYTRADVSDANGCLYISPQQNNEGGRLTFSRLVGSSTKSTNLLFQKDGSLNFVSNLKGQNEVDNMYTYNFDAGVSARSFMCDNLRCKSIFPIYTGTYDIGSASQTFKDVFAYSLGSTNSQLELGSLTPAGKWEQYGALGVNSTSGYVFPVKSNGAFSLGTGSNRFHILNSVNPVNVSSDKRDKVDIHYLDEGKAPLHIIEGENPRVEQNMNLTTKDMYNFIKDELRLASYRYKVNLDKGITDVDYNFIAQDILFTKVGSEIVKLEDKNDLDSALSYNQGNLISTVIGALQEEISLRDKQIQDLEKRLSKLENQGR